jgi:hypothetical protein
MENTTQIDIAKFSESLSHDEMEKGRELSSTLYPRSKIILTRLELT